MAEYYLVSQLPSLDGITENMPVPITEERFCELCESQLGKNALDEFRKITLLPAKEIQSSRSRLIEAWNEGERDLRFALSVLRSEKQKKSVEEVGKALPVSLMQTARNALEIENPMEAEVYLNNYRLEFLETLRPMDSFSEDYVFYYGLKLKLILRMRRFDKNAGMAAYRKIYNSIMGGDKLEAMQ